MNLAAFVLAILGMACCAFSQSRHRQMWPWTPLPSQQVICRWAWLCLFGSAVVAIWQYGAAIGVVVFIGSASLAGAIILLALSRR